MKLLDRYVISQSLQLMVIGGLAVIGIFLGTAEFETYMRLLNQFGLPLSTVLTVILLQIPTGVVFCLPAAVLFSTMFMIIRQHNDSELIVLQTSGVRLYRVMLPYLIFGALAGLCAFAFNEKLAPESRHLSKKITMLGIYKTGSPFRKRPKFESRSKEGKIDQVWMFGDSQNGEKLGFLALDLRGQGIIKLIWAERARWQEGAWKLKEGRIFELFDEYQNGLRGKFSAMNFNNKMLVEAIQSGNMSTWSKTAEQIIEEIKQLKSENKAVPPELRLQLHRRFSHPASCLLVVFATLPVALFRRRRSRSASFIYGGVLISAFFVVQQICISLAENGRLEPFIAAWLPGSLLCLVGIVLTLFLKDR